MLNTAKIIVGSSDPYPAGLERERWECWQAAWNAARPQPELEPDGGNFYKPHKMMVHSGKFWRCAHGHTGLDGIKCHECKNPNEVMVSRKEVTALCEAIEDEAVDRTNQHSIGYSRGRTLTAKQIRRCLYDGSITTNRED